ncbi:MAG: AhpC/TSA family protein [Akkermansiaceae bacterium]|nr:AhpC/TSA family protein [Armatimonadota bacterium]
MNNSFPHRLEVGNTIPFHSFDTIHGKTVQIPDPNTHWVHLQFRRYAGCPVCNRHLRTFAKRADEVAAAGIREIAVFHSSAKEMRTYQGELPFATVADPEKILYRAFGVEASAMSLLNPKAWGAMVTGAVRVRAATVAEGGKFGLPADFLVAPDGRLVAVHYGEHADDQWSVNDLLALAAHAT